METGVGLQDAQDHLRVATFLLGDLQQHTAVRSGVFGERFIRLVRGVLLGIALAERFVDAGDARRIRPEGQAFLPVLRK